MIRIGNIFIKFGTSVAIHSLADEERMHVFNVIHQGYSHMSSVRMRGGQNILSLVRTCE